MRGKEILTMCINKVLKNFCYERETENGSRNRRNECMKRKGGRETHEFKGFFLRSNCKPI